MDDISSKSRDSEERYALLAIGYLLWERMDGYTTREGPNSPAKMD